MALLLSFRKLMITGSYDEDPKACCYKIEGFSEYICNVDNIQRS